MAHNDYKDGWGVVDKRGLNVKTVSDTRRAAIINWLVTTSGLMILNSHTDEQVEALWADYGRNVMVRPVRTYVQDAGLIERDALDPTQEYTLRAMATNYAPGNSWDDLDKKAVTKAADEIKALRALLSHRVAGGAVAWRHKKRGTTYRILHGVEYADAIGSSASCPQMDHEPMVVYQDIASGRVWVRPRSEFFDGRFEQIDTDRLRHAVDQ